MSATADVEPPSTHETKQPSDTPLLQLPSTLDGGLASQVNTYEHPETIHQRQLSADDEPVLHLELATVADHLAAPVDEQPFEDAASLNGVAVTGGIRRPSVPSSPSSLLDVEVPFKEAAAALPPVEAVAVDAPVAAEEVAEPTNELTAAHAPAVEVEHADELVNLAPVAIFEEAIDLEPVVAVETETVFEGDLASPIAIDTQPAEESSLPDLHEILSAALDNLQADATADVSQPLEEIIDVKDAISSPHAQEISEALAEIIVENVFFETIIEEEVEEPLNAPAPSNSVMFNEPLVAQGPGVKVDVEEVDEAFGFPEDSPVVLLAVEEVPEPAEYPSLKRAASPDAALPPSLPSSSHPSPLLPSLPLATPIVEPQLPIVPDVAASLSTVEVGVSVPPYPDEGVRFEATAIEAGAHKTETAPREFASSATASSSAAQDVAESVSISPDAPFETTAVQPVVVAVEIASDTNPPPAQDAATPRGKVDTPAKPTEPSCVTLTPTTLASTTLTLATLTFGLLSSKTAHRRLLVALGCLGLGSIIQVFKALRGTRGRPLLKRGTAGMGLMGLDGWKSRRPATA